MRNRLKIFAIFVGCFLFRLIPLRAPNVEPIMAAIMPVGITNKNSKKYSILISFLFGFLSIFLFDLVTHFGTWTWITAITYGIIGIIATLFFQKFKAKTSNFVLFAVIATIFYDLVTGVLFAPIFHQTILNALIMQIPFTVLHLTGNIGFALTISPVLSRWLSRSFVLNTSETYIEKTKKFRSI